MERKKRDLEGVSERMCALPRDTIGLLTALLFLVLFC